MENISFVLWMVLWPVAAQITSGFAAAQRRSNREALPTKNVKEVAVILNLVIWLVIGWLLYN